MRSYTDLPQLRFIVLEESYVLAACARPGSLTIDAELVLTPEHPDYAPPAPGESECYRRGQLRFTGVRYLLWERQAASPAIDASGEIDYGHIDDLRWEDETYEIEGDIGRLKVIVTHLEVELAPTSGGPSA